MRDDEVVGYAIRTAGRVVEVGALDAHRDDVLAGVLTAFSGVTISVPPAHWLVRALRSYDHVLCVRRSWEGGHMLRIVDPIAFARAFGHDAPSASPRPLSDAAARELLIRAAGLSESEGRALWGDAPYWSPLDEL
jgi:hypothetical protein